MPTLGWDDDYSNSLTLDPTLNRERCKHIPIICNLENIAIDGVCELKAIHWCNEGYTSRRTNLLRGSCHGLPLRKDFFAITAPDFYGQPEAMAEILMNQLWCGWDTDSPWTYDHVWDQKFCCAKQGGFLNESLPILRPFLSWMLSESL